MFSHKKFWAMAIIAALVFASCSPKKDKDRSTEEQKKIKILLWHSQGGANADYLEMLASKFTASQDRYEAEFVSYGNYAKTYQAGVAAYRAKKQPALLHVNEVTSADMMASQIYIPYQELMSKENLAEDWSDYISGVKSYYTNDKGELQAFPFNPSTILMYANKDMLKQAGITEIPDTWEELEATLKKLKDSGLPVYAAQLHSWYQVEQMLAVNNAAIATKDNGYAGLDAELEFNSPLMIKNLQNLKRWREEGLLTFQSAMGGQTGTDAFQAQKAAIILSSAGGYATIRTGVGESFDWDVYPLPHFAESSRYNSLVGGGALWVLDGLPEEVYSGVAQLFHFMLQRENQIDFVKKTGFLPTHTSTYQSLKEQGLLEQKEYGGVKVSIQSLQGNKTGAYNKGIHLGFFPQIRNIWKTKAEEFLLDNMSAQEAMDQAVSEGNEQLRKFEKIYQ